MDKPAVTEHDIHPLLKSRWSPRAFSSQSIEPHELMSLFEAARWSPSGGNRQPWGFVVVAADDRETHEALVEILSENNRTWAYRAPVLVLSVARPDPQTGSVSRFTYYDVGQAVAHLTVQASALGLFVHQMAGFDADKARQLLALPDGYEPMTVIAIGRYGDPSDLPDTLREREFAARSRKPFAEILFRERWDAPLK